MNCMLEKPGPKFAISRRGAKLAVWRNRARFGAMFDPFRVLNPTSKGTVCKLLSPRICP
ncbi:hypothetical protein AURDEDRAFT_172758 [Auricularia subglabra TFB-10046 SS5]|nr:hypothetical protein AURDEDRAFT_172758 [Auricularia subglabra TFB-10046 SS5]